MLFSTKAEYGVRLMVELGRRAGDGRAGGAEPVALGGGRRGRAAAALLPRAPGGEAAPGRAGRPRCAARTAATGSRGRPSEIAMLDVVEALEGPIAPMECFHAEREGRVLCSHETDGDRACATKLLWTRVQGGVTKALAGHDARRPGRVRRPARAPSRRHAGRLATDDRQPTTTWSHARPRDPQPARERRGQGDPQGPRPRGLEGRGARADGAERLRQVDARERDHGPPGARGHRGRDRLRGRRTSPRPPPRSARAPASSWPSSTRSRSPA